MVGVSAQELGSYLSLRQDFLAKVIQADLQTLPALRAAPEAVGRSSADVAATPQDQSDSPDAVVSDSIPEMLLELVAQRTGFPRDSLSMQRRLLDDLGLDSIKATSRD